MSLSDTDVDNKYSANGVTTDFAIPQEIIEDDSAEVQVFIVDESVDPQTETLQVEGALQDYTLIGSSPPGTPFNTTVRFNAAPASGLKVYICRAIELIQEVDLTPGGAVPLDTIELMSDRLTAIAQFLERKLQRTFKLRQSNRSLLNPSVCDLVTPGATLIINDTLDGLIEGPTAATLIAIATAAAASAAAAALSAAAAAASAAAALASEIDAAASAAEAAAYAGNFQVDTFIGNGILDHFDLTFNPGSKNNTLVFVDDIYQPKSTYSLTGVTLTLGGVVPDTAVVEVITMTRGTIVATPDDDIVTSPIASSQTDLEVVGLYFNGAVYRSVTITYYVHRYTTGGGGSERVQSGRLVLNYTDSDGLWVITEFDRLGEAGVTFDVVAASGQVIYTSDAQLGTVSDSKMVSTVASRAV